MLLTHAAFVHDRPRKAFHPLAQAFDQLLVDHELPIVVRDLVRGQRLEAFGRRNVRVAMWPWMCSVGSIEWLTVPSDISMIVFDIGRGGIRENP